MTLTPRAIAGRPVLPIGLGCMNFNHAYGQAPSAEQARAVFDAALAGGMTLIDTAALYGFGANETLLGPWIRPLRDRILLCSKGGLAGETFPEGTKRVIDGRPEAIRRHCEGSLQRLGVDHIDLYYLHRWDKRVPVEESVGEMARLKAEGKIGALGLSEVSAATLRRAHAVHPIAAVQSEYSLWSRNGELGVLQACCELGVAYVAFSPLGRGVLTAEPPDPAAFDAKDIRRAMPRFDATNYPHNLQLVAAHQALAAEAGCTPAQLALAYVLAQGEHIIALPGTTQVRHLQDNLGALTLELSGEMRQRLERLWHPGAPSGPRYNEQNSREVDSEEFPS